MSKGGALKKLLFGSEIVKTIDKGDIVEIPMVKVPKEQRGKGIARKELERLISEADASGKALALTPSGDFGADKKRLEKFYKSLGFSENKGKKKDFRTTESMIREPNVLAAGSGLGGILASQASGAEAIKDRASLIPIGSNMQIGAPQNPRLASMADMAGQYNQQRQQRTPHALDFLLPGGEMPEEYLRKLSYGQDVGWSDRIGALLGLL